MPTADEVRLIRSIDTHEGVYYEMTIEREKARLYSPVSFTIEKGALIPALPKYYFKTLKSAREYTKERIRALIAEGAWLRD
ncbi:hypothetical protein [Dyella sp. 20L07]|uniref:hypothetical protein n=1 Tax=Dyella sp. 20L07 TaxID=3384240 RepID=UPI003D2A4C4D